MLLNYLKIAVRTVKRSVSYTLINVSGLAMGFACALVIFAVADYHLGFDNFHTDPQRIYRFVTESHRDQVSYSPSVPPAFGNAFRNDYSFGEAVARVCTLSEKLIAVERDGEAIMFKEQISFADPDFLGIFNFPLISGTRVASLREPNTAVISERMARKYFGTEPAVGQTLRFENRIDFTITGILKDIPANTDLQSEIYFSYTTLRQYNDWYAADDSWGGITSDIQTFVKLQPGITPAEVEKILPDYVKKYRAESKNIHHYKLQPLNDIHFNPAYSGRVSKSMILVLAFVGLLLIVVASLNFVNLATAKAIRRSKEVGVRKTLGSSGKQLFLQFSTETGVIVVLAAMIATAVAYAFMPYVNGLFNTQIALQLFTDVKVILFLLALILIVTFLSSAYPGIILSRFRPAHALRGESTPATGSLGVKRGMIIAQFTIAQILLIGLIVVVYQVRHFKHTDMGFIKDAVVMIPVGNGRAKIDGLKSQLSQTPGVEDVTVCLAAPASDDEWNGSFRFDNRSEKEDFSVSFKSVDDHYLSTFGIELVAGRNLTPSDTIREFLVNEKLVAKLGLTSPEDILGKQIAVNGDEWRGSVIGVVKDFHDQSLRSEIHPILMTTNKDYYNVLGVRIAMANARTTLAAVQRYWSETYPEDLYEYAFLDDQIAAFYKIEETILKLTQVSSLIALLIGCTGLYGLVSLLAVQKTKEIGIRKVLGGSLVQILWIFIKEFLLVVIVAFVLAAPVAWQLLTLWLENYTYHVELTPWIFLLAMLIMFVIVALTVGYQSVRAALMNPVKSLRSE